MTSSLGVDPTHLRAAAAQEAETGAYVSSTGVEAALNISGTSMPGLLSGDACRYAGTVFETVNRSIGDELTAHSDKLRQAADQYTRVDAELGRRLAKFVGK